MEWCKTGWVQLVLYQYIQPAYVRVVYYVYVCKTVVVGIFVAIPAAVYTVAVSVIPYAHLDANRTRYIAAGSVDVVEPWREVEALAWRTVWCTSLCAQAYFVVDHLTILVIVEC